MMEMNKLLKVPCSAWNFLYLGFAEKNVLIWPFSATLKFFVIIKYLVLFTSNEYFPVNGKIALIKGSWFLILNIFETTVSQNVLFCLKLFRTASPTSLHRKCFDRNNWWAKVSSYLYVDKYIYIFSSICCSGAVGTKLSLPHSTFSCRFLKYSPFS